LVGARLDHCFPDTDGAVLPPMQMKLELHHETVALSSLDPLAEPEQQSLSLHLLDMLALSRAQAGRIVALSSVVPLDETEQ